MLRWLNCELEIVKQGKCSGYLVAAMEPTHSKVVYMQYFRERV
jgi:hypothetical protein